MSEKESIYIFDDGSLASRLLQHELKDKYNIKLIGVNIASDILECFTKVQPDKKVHLHYTYEKYSENHEKLRKDIQKVEALGFKNLVVLDYEGLDEKTMKYRARVAGIKDDIKLTGKPEAIAISEPETVVKEYTFTVVDPDDEMKAQAHDIIRDIDKRDNIEKEDKSITRKFRKKFL